MSILCETILKETYSQTVIPKHRLRPSRNHGSSVLFKARGAPGKSVIGLLLMSSITKPSYIRGPVLDLLDQSFGLDIIKTWRPWRSLIECGSLVQSRVIGL